MTAANQAATAVVPVDMNRLFRRDTAGSTAASDMQGFKGAILVKNGQATSCEIALMTNTYGFVAAACLDFIDTAGKMVNQSTVYEVAISSGGQGSYGSALVTRVTVNPNYDPKTFANNLAVVQYNSGGYSFVNYIASWRPDWSNLYFVRRGLGNAGSSAWNAPVVASYNATSDLADCARANRLFLANQSDLMCNRLSIPATNNASCSVPYGSVYGVNGANIAIAGLYSHSATYGQDGLCGAVGQLYNYYIVLENYVHWAMSVLSVRVPVYHSRIPEYTENMNPNYSMVNPQQPSDISGVQVFGGDLYHLKPADKDVSETVKTVTKLSGVAIAAIVLGVLLLLALLVFLYRRMQKGKLGAMNRVREWWLFGRRTNHDDHRDSRRPPTTLSFL
ncbi:hypothetical protein GGI04_004031 [Coemansia thaxteri]|nr:hypothetical protein GGI04_004031 [Coemansia thaxteri]KAJ2467830.1 hypothetical protein GGI02_003895 [Coemansia sp. RSA 2322]